MITWMQRHRKYLVITLWISTGAFIAAGPIFAIGSSNFSSQSADAVAKVGNLEITLHQMNATYSQLFSRYNKLLKGKFDKAQAKALGLEQQALRQLVDQTLLLNLANDMKLVVSDKELAKEIASTEVFFKDGKFDKATMQKVLQQNNLSIALYEEDVRRGLLLQKLSGLLSVTSSPLETEAISTALYVQDKIDYKVMDRSMITITPKEEEVKAYWDENKLSYMTEPQYEIEVLEQTAINKDFTEEELKDAYTERKYDFKNADGEIKVFDEAKEELITALLEELTEAESRRTFFKYKNNELNATAISTQTMTISQSSNPFGENIYEKITKTPLDKPFIKPENVDGKYLMFKLIKTTPSQPKEYQDAFVQAKTDYITAQTEIEFNALVKNSVDTFKGEKTPFITRESIDALTSLTQYEAYEFLEALFSSNTKRGYIELKNKKVVLYNILEQKLLTSENNMQERNALRLKTTLLNDGLLAKLKSKYPVVSYMQIKDDNLE